MADYQITCITPDQSDPDRRIDAVGGPAFGTIPLDTAIRWIRELGHRFWTVDPVSGVSVWVHYVPATVWARHHLTTSPDGIQPNNLLRLRPCQ
jgi:hypothetical protein